MDFVSTALVTLKQPTGFWPNILNAFKSATGTYIVAVILIALIVRVVFSLVDIINKKVNMKNMNINAKMRPELEAIQKKYGNDQRVVQQKTGEVYKKYQFSMMSTCLPMLVTMVLQFTVFLTLWNSLQSVSNYNIAEKYENMKNVYANVLVLNENDAVKAGIADYNAQEDTLEVEVDIKSNKLKIVLTHNEITNVIGELDFISDWTNEDISNLIKKYNPSAQTQPEETTEETPAETAPTIEYVDTGYNEVFKALAEKTANTYYIENQEGFLWIKNIYKSESPTSPMFTKTEITKYLSGYYTEDEKTLEEANGYEGFIFDFVVSGMDKKTLGLNGYYILTIVAVLTSFLSLWLSNKLMKNKNQPAQPAQSKMMYFIMPIIIGIFTFMYTSLFAIYLIVGQLVTMLLTPLTTFIVRKWLEADEKKQKDQTVVEVDYRRKDK